MKSLLLLFHRGGKISFLSTCFIHNSSFDPIYLHIHSYSTKNGHMPDLLRFPVRIDKRSAWENILNESDTNGLGIMLTYPDSIDGISELKAALKGQSCPTAKKLPHQLVTLPIHPYVSKKDIKKIRKMFSKEISK